MWKFRWWLADRIERFSALAVEVLRYSKKNRHTGRGGGEKTNG